MPTAHIGADGTITLVDPGTPEDAAKAEEGLLQIISALAKMAVRRIECENHSRVDEDLIGDTLVVSEDGPAV